MTTSYQLEVNPEFDDSLCHNVNDMELEEVQLANLQMAPSWWSYRHFEG